MSKSRKVGGKGTKFDVVLAEFLLSANKVAVLGEDEHPEIAFAGRSNVGKSSLMNTLLQRRGLVRTSSKPGCTTAINVFLAKTRAGLEVRLVDLPGFGYARRSKSERASWGPLIEGYLARRKSLRGVVLLVDVRRGMEQEEFLLVDFLQSLDRGAVPLQVVATKIDKLSKSEWRPAVQAIAKQVGAPVVAFSAKTGQGREELWGRLERWVSEAPDSNRQGEPSSHGLDSVSG